MDAPRVLVVRVDRPPSYAVARALQLCGVEVAGTTAARWLRSGRIECFPVDARNGDSLSAESLIHACKASHCSVVLPVADEDISQATGFANDLESHGITVLAPSQQAQRLARDKEETILLGQKCGFPIPTSSFVRGVSEIEAMLDKTLFPAIVKPSRGKSATDVILVNSVASLIDTTTTLLSRHPCVVVQEYIPGGKERSINLVLDSQARVCGSFTLRKLRYLQPSRSVAVEVIAPLPETRYAEEMAKAAGWSGFVSFQTKLDERDGTNKLIEVNCRYGNNARILLALEPRLAISVLDSLLGLATARHIPAVGAIGVSPIEDLLSIWLLAFQKFHARSIDYSSLGNRLPSFGALFRSIAQTYRRGTKLDLYTRALWDDPLIGASYALEQILPQLFPDTKTLIPWGEIDV